LEDDRDDQEEFGGFGDLAHDLIKCESDGDDQNDLNDEDVFDAFLADSSLLDVVPPSFGETTHRPLLPNPTLSVAPKATKGACWVCKEVFTTRNGLHSHLRAAHRAGDSDK